MLFFHPDLLKADLKGWLLVFGGGGLLVAVFEVAYPYAITGVSVAGAAALLYLAPVVVAVLARFILGEALTPLRMFLAVLVMIGVRSEEHTSELQSHVNLVCRLLLVNKND